VLTEVFVFFLSASKQMLGYVKLFLWTLSIVLNYKIIKQRFGSWILLPSSGKKGGKRGQKTYLSGTLLDLASDLDLVQVFCPLFPHFLAYFP
jgi:hypothetical protein